MYIEKLNSCNFVELLFQKLCLYKERGGNKKKSLKSGESEQSHACQSANCRPNLGLSADFDQTE